MQFNLKNRPKTCYEQNLCVADADITYWFEGFEKELRELRKKPYLSSESKRIITEILGENNQN